MSTYSVFSPNRGGEVIDETLATCVHYLTVIWHGFRPVASKVFKTWAKIVKLKVPVGPNKLELLHWKYISFKINIVLMESI